MLISHKYNGGCGAMITYEEVHKLFDYDDKSGNLVWKKKIAKKVIVGNIAGFLRKDGYRIITVSKKRYLAHRLIFFYHYGYFPENDVDHKKGNPENNKIKNLREISRQCNLRNSKIGKNSKYGVKGIHWNSKDNRWIPSLSLNGKTVKLGSYKDFDEAICHRLAAEQCLDWNECNNSSSAYRYVRKKIQKRKRRRTCANIS